MPQNGIYHLGITALSAAFKNNKHLQILNLNDNTIGPVGCKAIANILPHLQNLKEINFGDCLIRNEGAKYLAAGLKNCPKLESITLGFNEIRKDGGLELVKALSDKTHLTAVILDGNNFGSEGRDVIKNKLKDIGKANVLGSLSEDDSVDSEDDDDTEEEHEQDDEEESEEIAISTTYRNGIGKEKDPLSNSLNHSTNDIQIIESLSLNEKTATVTDFLNKPNADNFLALGSNVSNLLLKEAEVSKNFYLTRIVVVKCFLINFLKLVITNTY